MTPEHEALILKLGRDRLLAHQSLFRHRHPDPTPPFHADVIRLWHSRDQYALCMVFREGGKSTIAEEAFVIGAGYQLFHNAMIVGSTEKRAVERLRAIKHEIRNNENVEALFGPLTGETWNEAEIILANGVRIVAVGRGQSLRGTKHLHYRPDFIFCDDIEEEENVKDEQARSETLSWFMRVVIPALDKHGRIRVNATPLHRDALPFRLRDELKWPCYTFPIEHIDEKGERKATWEARYPLSWIDKKKAAFAAVGKLDDYMREYMCVAEDPKQKLFTPDLIRIEPRQRTWHPTWAFFDPARTTKPTSATTGWAVWSWIANRLIVWDGDGQLLKPDEIVKKIFEVNDEYAPVEIGVEEDGLNEFLLQPIRAEMIRRGRYIPIRAMKAPKGKLGFIEGLHPFFAAREVVFAADLREMFRQLQNYPSGRIDAPNALAYALPMRPGQVVYEDFNGDHVAVALKGEARKPSFLALNAGDGFVTGVLCQSRLSMLLVLADWVLEGDPGSAAGAIVREASLLCDGEINLVAPQNHWSGYNHLGLRGAVAKIPAELRRGAPLTDGRDEIRALLTRRVKENPALVVSDAARWTLSALAAGYAYEIDKRGLVKGEPKEGPYKVLMNGLEAFAGLLRSGIMSARERPNMQRTADGRAFISALPGRAGVADAKDEILVADRISDMPLSARR